MRDDLVTIRSSNAPKARICPGSIRGGAMRIRRHNEQAPLGTAAHECMSLHLQGAEFSVSEVAAKHGLGSDAELAMLVRFGIKAWAELSATYGPARTEVFLKATLADVPRLAMSIAGTDPPLQYTGSDIVIGELADVSYIAGGPELTGHMDAIRIVPELRWAGVVDWKSGRLDANYRDQVAAYAFLVFANEPNVDTVDCAVVWLRDQTQERYRFTRAQALAWRDEFVARVVKWDGTYYTGEHCGHCDRSHDCPALAASARRDLAILQEQNVAEDVIAGNIKALDDVTLAGLLRKVNGLSKFFDTFGDVARAEIRSRGGSIDAGNGQEYRFLVTEPREIDTLKAWPVLQSRMSDEELASCAKVSVSKAADIVKSHAAKGKGAAAVRELDAALEDAEAVSRRRQESLRLVRK